MANRQFILALPLIPDSWGSNAAVMLSLNPAIVTVKVPYCPGGGGVLPYLGYSGSVSLERAMFFLASCCL